MWEEFKNKVNTIYEVGEAIVNIFLFLIRLPEVLSAKILLVTNYLPWNVKLDGNVAFIKWIIFAYALFMWGRKIWGFLSITNMVPILGWLIRLVVGYSLIVGLLTLVNSGIWSAMVLLLVTMFFFNRNWFSSLGGGARAIGRGGANLASGMGRLSVGTISALGSIKAFRGNPKAKPIAKGFADLYAAFETEPRLQRNGEFDVPAFHAALDNFRSQLLEKHPDDEDVIETMYEQIREGLDLRTPKMTPGGEVLKDTLIRMA